jgi:hypothetical protein
LRFQSHLLDCIIQMAKVGASGGFLATSIVALFVNFALGIGIGQSLLGLLGVALLYAVLQIGKENKGWPQLE